MPAKKKTGPKDETEKRRGRPELPPDEKTHPRTIRLNDARWEKYKLLGREWLEKELDSATAEKQGEMNETSDNK